MDVPLSWILIVLLPICQQYLRGKSRRRLWKCIRSLHTQSPFAKMAKATTPFFDVVPASTNFTCVAPLSHRRCTKLISRKHRNKAIGIRRGLSVCPPSHPAFATLLEEYARSCLCANVHDKYDAILTATVSTWSKQLTAVFEALSLDYDLAHLLVPGAFETTDISDLQQSATESFNSSVTLPPTAELTLNRYQAIFNSLPNNVEGDHLPESYLDVVDTSHDPSRSNDCRFQLYLPKSKKTLEEVVWAPLGVEDRKPGHIYAFTRENDENYVKIGYTSGSVGSRLEQWQRDCKYRPILVRDSIAMVPNAKRIETLIHTDLENLSARRRDIWCLTNHSCGKTHTEWFEISHAEATRIIEYWIDWMTSHCPYKSTGQLEERCILDIHLPNSQLEANPDARRFTSDSSGRAWDRARANQSQTGLGTNDTEQENFAVAQTADTMPLDDQRLTPHSLRSPRTPPAAPALLTPSRRSLGVTASEPNLTLSARWRADSEHAADYTPSRPAASRYFTTSSMRPSLSTRPSNPRVSPDQRQMQSGARKRSHEESNETGPDNEAVAGDMRSQSHPPIDFPAGSSSSRAPSIPRSIIPDSNPFEGFQWPCPQCTFVNSAFTSICEVCRYAVPDFNSAEDLDLLPVIVGPLSHR